jgi:hypothetical protein
MAERYMFTRNRQAPGTAQIIFFKEVFTCLQQTDNKYFKIKKAALERSLLLIRCRGREDFISTFAH